MQTFDVIDAVIGLGLAVIAIVLAAAVFLSSHHGRNLTVRGHTLGHTRLLGSALVLIGVVLVLRLSIDIVPLAWRNLAIIVTGLSAAALLVVTIIAITRSRRP